jgi:hypothetical protein
VVVLTQFKLIYVNDFWLIQRYYKYVGILSLFYADLFVTALLKINDRNKKGTLSNKLPIENSCFSGNSPRMCSRPPGVDFIKQIRS